MLIKHIFLITVHQSASDALVSLKRTFKSNVWNTIVLPFSMTEDELKAAFGDDVKVAEYSENSSSADNVTVTFTTMATPAITANEPVLIKSNSQIGTYLLENIELADVSGNNVKTGNHFSLQGVYASSFTVAEGDYFLSGNKLYRSAGQTTIKGTRAYLKANDMQQNARIISLNFDDNRETGIVDIPSAPHSQDVFYNLAGQRIAKSNMRKGQLYISRDKKTIVVSNNYNN